MSDVHTALTEVFESRRQLGLEDLRTLISEVEALMLTHSEPVELPLTHHFSKGVYAREIKMPKGSMLVGKIHKHQNLNILSGGEVSVLSVDGVIRVKAPYTFVGSPGAKRVIYAHEDVTWTTIHATTETDVDKIEAEVIAKSYEEVEALASGTEVKNIQGE